MKGRGKKKDNVRGETEREKKGKEGENENKRNWSTTPRQISPTLVQRVDTAICEKLQNRPLSDVHVRTVNK